MSILNISNTIRNVQWVYIVSGGQVWPLVFLMGQWHFPSRAVRWMKWYVESQCSWNSRWRFCHAQESGSNKVWIKGLRGSECWFVPCHTCFVLKASHWISSLSVQTSFLVINILHSIWTFALVTSFCIREQISSIFLLTQDVWRSYHVATWLQCIFEVTSVVSLSVLYLFQMNLAFFRLSL